MDSLRLFPDRKDVTIVEVLPLFTEMYDELGNEDVNPDLEYNLEIIQNALKGKIDVTQPNFNVYGYNVNCARNEKLGRGKKTLETFIINGNLTDEMHRDLRNGGKTEDFISFHKKLKDDSDPYTGGEYERGLVMKDLKRIQGVLKRKGILLCRLLKSAQEGHKTAQNLLADVMKRNQELRDALLDASEMWETDELTDELAKGVF